MQTYRHDSINITTGAKHQIKEWTVGVDVEDEARKQLYNAADLPFIYKHVAAMPDTHAGIGCTVGAVIPTSGAVVPAFVGVDLGCGICLSETTLQKSHLGNLAQIRQAIESEVPHGRTDDGGENDKGAWHNVPPEVQIAWMELEPGYKKIIAKHPKISHKQCEKQLGTLGSGNHYLELTIDENDKVHVFLHSGSRGIGNKIGTYFIDLAKKEMKKYFIELPDPNCAYLPENTELFDDYIEAVLWAQRFAKVNRELMKAGMLRGLKKSGQVPKFEEVPNTFIDCHHNYVEKEYHFGKSIWVTRKGAVRARKGELGLIPGSMGTKSYVVRGLGNEDSFMSCSHGAGRKMSRTKAKQTISVKEHIEATKGVECRKDASVIDESPAAYKDIDTVINAQSELVEIVHTLKQVLCVKG
jgi:tRNA-splicing ligase RtcB